VVRQEIKRINQLKGKILATAQFTEAEFFLRHMLDTWCGTPGAFTVEAMAATVEDLD